MPLQERDTTGNSDHSHSGELEAVVAQCGAPLGDQDKREAETASEILLRFCRTTSLRGIPRIVSGDSGLLRGLWLVCFSALVIACSVNLHQIVSLYFAYDVVQMPVFSERPDSTFPSITVCNQIPLSVQGRKRIYANGWRQPREFWSAVLNSQSGLSRLNLTGKQLQQVVMYLPGLFSLNGYFSNLPHGHSPYDLGFSKEQLIRSCYLLVRSGTAAREPPVSSPPCDSLGSWRLVHDQNRLNCYAFSLRPEVRDPVVEMEIRLFLGHDLGLPCDDCITMDANTQITGVRVVLHENGSFPDVSKEGFNVYPGTMTEVRFSTNNWTRLKAPHGLCRDSVPRHVRLFGHKFGYSQDACKKARQQALIERHCGCTFAFLPHSARNASDFCERLDGDISSFSAAGVARAALRSRCGLLSLFDASHADADTAACPQPCSSLTFETSTTQAQWPRESMQLHLFQSELWRGSGLRINDSVQIKPQASRADQEEMLIRQLYLQIAKMIKTDEMAATNLIKRHGLVSRSFLTLKVSRRGFTVVQMRDKPVRTLASTLSQVGGLLSMWLGLTLVWFVELLELLLRLGCRLRLSFTGSGSSGSNSSCHSQLQLKRQREDGQQNVVDESLATMISDGKRVQQRRMSLHVEVAAGRASSGRQKPSGAVLSEESLT